MQPGSHGKLAYKIRGKVPQLKTYGTGASNGYFTKSELRAIARELDIDWFEMKDELEIDRVCNRHLRFKILEECDGLGLLHDSPERLNSQFTKGQKRSILKELEERNND